MAKLLADNAIYGIKFKEPHLVCNYDETTPIVLIIILGSFVFTFVP